MVQTRAQTEMRRRNSSDQKLATAWLVYKKLRNSHREISARRRLAKGRQCRHMVYALTMRMAVIEGVIGMYVKYIFTLNEADSSDEHSDLEEG